MPPSQEGERAERLTNTLLGAKDGGQHHQQRTSASTSLRRMIRRFALATLSYDNMVPRPKIDSNHERIEVRNMIGPVENLGRDHIFLNLR